MVKTLMLIVLLLVSAVWLQAESASLSSDKNQNSSDLTTIQGCLQTSLGEYTLTEKDGTIHQLTGAANKLGHHVGHEVELSGKPAVKTVDTTGAGTASSAALQAVFEVRTVKYIAARCR